MLGDDSITHLMMVHRQLHNKFCQCGDTKRTDRQNEDGDGPCFFPVCLPAAEKTVGVFSFCPVSESSSSHVLAFLAAASHIFSSESGRRVPGWRGGSERRAVGEKLGGGGKGG